MTFILILIRCSYTPIHSSSICKAASSFKSVRFPMIIAFTVKKKSGKSHCDITHTGLWRVRMNVIAGVICFPGSAWLCPFLKGNKANNLFSRIKRSEYHLKLFEFVCRFICLKWKEWRTIALRWRETTDSEGVHSSVSDQSKNSPESYYFCNLPVSFLFPDLKPVRSWNKEYFPSIQQVYNLGL